MTKKAMVNLHPDSKKAFYKQIWFWLAFSLIILVILSSIYYVYENKSGVSKTNYNKIKVSSHKFGQGGTSFEEAQRILGEPLEISSPNRMDYKQQKDANEPVYYDVKWRDKNVDDADDNAASAESTNDYGTEKGTIEIKFSSKDGSKESANAISKEENI